MELAILILLAVGLVIGATSLAVALLQLTTIRTHVWQIAQEAKVANERYAVLMSAAEKKFDEWKRQAESSTTVMGEHNGDLKDDQGFPMEVARNQVGLVVGWRRKGTGPSSTSATRPTPSSSLATGDNPSSEGLNA